MVSIKHPDILRLECMQPVRFREARLRLPGLWGDARAGGAWKCMHSCDILTPH